jgi:hypothetical protein
VWVPVHDAERAEGISVRSDQGNARVGDDLRLGAGGALSEDRVAAGVGHEERLPRSDGVFAERVGERRLTLGGERLRQPALALEELTVAVHQRNERHRNVEDGRRQPRQPVEHLLGRGIEERRPAQGIETFLVLKDTKQVVLGVGVPLLGPHLRTTVLRASRQTIARQRGGESAAARFPMATSFRTAQC